MSGKFLDKIFLFVIIILCIPSNAYAYIDPGTGSFIIQSIIAIGGAIVIYLSYPIRILKNIYKKIFKKNKIKNNTED